MKNKILILIIGILIFSNCKSKGEIEYSFEDVPINESHRYLTLPTGIIKNEVEDYTEGIYQHFIYSDNSMVVISTNGMGQIEKPKKENSKSHWRYEIVDGIQILYFNVKTERKAEFDKAFELMKTNGIKKK